MGNPSGIIDELKREALIRALEECSGHRGMTAEILGVSRRTVTNWINLYQLYELFPSQFNPYVGRPKGQLDA